MAQITINKELSLVSVIIPVHNGAQYISDTLNSVLRQTYKNIEIIVVDDASTDNTLSVLKPFTSETTVSIIKIAKNSGAAVARNVGYAHSRGTLIKFLDGDDLINPIMIERQVALSMNEDNIISAQWGRFQKSDIKTFKLSPEECWKTMDAAEWIVTSWKRAQPMTTPGIFLIPRRLIEKAGLWNEHLSLLDDTDFFARIIAAAGTVMFSGDSILYYRSGLENSLSKTKTRKGYMSAFSALESATNALLCLRNDHMARLACANLWQNFVYDVYPNYPDLMHKAEQHLTHLPNPDLPFPSGGYTKMLLRLFHWKTVKFIKQLFNKKS